MNIVETFFKDCNLDKIAYIIDDETITYRQLQKKTNQYRSFYKTQSLSNNVLILLPESFDLLASILACWSLGIATYHPSVTLPVTTIKLLCKNANTTHMITNTQLSTKVHVGCHFINIDTVKLSKEDTDYMEQDIDTEIFYGITTGSTGTPKMPVQTIYNILNWARVYSAELGLNEDSKIYTTSRISFNWGVSCAISMNLYSKSTCVLNTKIATPKLIKHNIETHRPTHFFTVPLFIDLLIKSKIDVDFTHVHLSMSSGDWLPEHLCTQFENQFGQQLLNGIGSSEAVSNYTFTPKYDSENINSLGKNIPEVDMKIMKDGKECASGEIGEIYVSSTFFSKSYLNFTDNTTYEDGWIKTKDLAYVNSNGCLVYMGRKNSIFKINGVFVNPLEIEKHILKFEGVTNCIVKSTDVENGVPKLAVDLICNKDINITQLRIFLFNKLEKNKIPKVFNVVKEIKRTWNGKTQRAIVNEI
jgi:acyl-coenzyme A synthetase/AMP-(fatty) acid ligase